MSDSVKIIKNRFEVGSEIASRSSCKVFIGKDRELGGKSVAIKLFLDKPGNNSEVVKLFDEEVASLKKASHQVLVPIVDGGLDQEEFYFVLEYLPGASLRDKIKEKSGPFEIDDAVGLISKLCEGLHELHGETFNGRQLIHGHLDSRAILFKGDEPRLAGYHPIAIDLLQKQMTSVARVAADAAYISPEQLSGSEKLDSRSDVYALGVLLFEMVCGERPFIAANPLQAAMLRMTTGAPQPSKKNPKITALLEAAILKSLAREQKDRFQSALEFRDALQGNKKSSKNPFFSEADRMSNETLAVSFSTADIQSMLKGVIPPGASMNPQEQVVTASQIPSSGGNLAEDTSQTIMGIQTGSILPASLVYLSGGKRGERVTLDKSQALIGSDPTCDICFSGKDIAARHALVIQKEGGYFLAPISSKGVDVNGTIIKAEEERKFERGDVVKLGGSELRFLAPGEVFTLKEEGVSHTIAKPKLQPAKYLLIAVLLLGVLSMGGLYIWRSNIDTAKLSAKREEAAKAKKRDEMVKKLIQEGDDLLKKGALTEPVGENALEKFQTVLTLESENSYAKRRLEELSGRKRQLQIDEERRRQLQGKLKELLGQGDYYIAQNQLVSPPGKNAKETFQEVLKLDPANSQAKAKIDEIDNMLRDVLGRVKGSLDKAKDYIAMGQYVDPQGENALEMIQQARKIDPDNKEANDLVYMMAAKSLLAGDRAKLDKQVKEVRRNYLTAQALGVDPACIEMKMKGLDLISRSTGKVVLANQDQECPVSGAGFLNSAELTKRVASMKLEEELKGH